MRSHAISSALALVVGLFIVLSPMASTAGQINPTTALAAAQEDPAEDSEYAPPPPPAMVSVAASPFGTKLVDRPGRTLYVFSLDAPGISTCDRECAAVWVPLRSYGGKPQPGPGVTAPEVGNIQRPDGSEQVTYNGYPLYVYRDDSGPGQSNGHGRSEFGGRWSAQPPPAPPGSR